MKSERIILFLSRDKGSVQSTIPVIQIMSKVDGCYPYVVCMYDEPLLKSMAGIKYVLADHNEYSVDPIGYLDNILKTSSAELVVSGSSPAKNLPPETPEQYLISIARKHGVPTIAILDFWGLYLERFADRNGKIDPNLIPDVLCVMDQIVKDDLVKLGVEAERICITQNPWFDKIADKNIKPCNSNFIKKQLLFVSQPLAESKGVRGWKYSQYSIFDELIYAINSNKQTKDWDIFIWPHPAENKIFWKANVLPKYKASGINIDVIDDKSKDLLACADLIVSSHSTVSYEAAYYSTPGISLRIDGPMLDEHITDKLGLTTKICTREELIKYFNNIDVDAERVRLKKLKNKLMKKNIFFSKGNAANTIAMIIKKILNKTYFNSLSCQNNV